MASVKELSKKYGYGLSTIQSWVHNKKLPASIHGRKFDVKEDDFIALLNSGKVGKPVGYYKRNRSNYTHYKKHTFLDNTEQVNKTTSRELAISALERYLMECYVSHDLTPYHYDYAVKLLNILKEKK